MACIMCLETVIDWGLESPQNPRAGKPALRGVNQATVRIFYAGCLRGPKRRERRAPGAVRSNFFFGGGSLDYSLLTGTIPLLRFFPFFTPANLGIR
jgi:hypothetical protein